MEGTDEIEMAGEDACAADGELLTEADQLISECIMIEKEVMDGNCCVMDYGDEGNVDTMVILDTTTLAQSDTEDVTGGEIEEEAEPFDEEVEEFNEEVELELEPSSSAVQQTEEDQTEFNAENLTKTGTVRKRKTYTLSKVERDKIKKTQKREARVMKGGCDESRCKIKCHQKVNLARRTEIYEYYWSLAKEARQAFVQSMVKIIPKKKNSLHVELSRRVNTVVYSFRDQNDLSVKVCKKFFLETLGHTIRHDHIIHHSPNITKRKTPRENAPGRKKYDRQVLIDHIESFNPTVSHYRRKHAPLRRYISSDVTIVKMWDDFKGKNPGAQCSYELYRTVVKELNISFTKLGHEECEVCEEYEIHKKVCEPAPDCDICVYWNEHIAHAKKSRELYQQMGVQENIPEGTIVYSVDLQKVIMLPRCEMFKSVIFVPRLATYNESFVPVGRNNKNPVHAFIWHEAIRGRLAQDIVSTFHNFVLANRDSTKIILWLDNCTAQNKNWSLLCFLVYAVNEINDISLQEIEIYFFEPGHTFMSCDSFHHLVEKSLREKSKVYDFIDFKHCVQAAKKSGTVHEMNVHNFSNWKDFSSKAKLQKMTPRPYLNKMKQIVATKGKYTIRYKHEFEDEGIELDFLQKKIIDKGFPPPEKVSCARGIESRRKDSILARLIEERGAIIPPQRVEFWKTLPCSEEVAPENDIQ